MKGEEVIITDLPPRTPPVAPRDGIGKVIARGDVAGTLGIEVARGIAADNGVTVIVTDISDEPAVAQEGLQTRVEIQPVLRSQN